MSDDSLKKSKNSEKGGSDNSKANEEEVNEEEDEEEDQVSHKNNNNNKNILLNSNEQTSNEGKKYIKLKKKNVNYEDKQVQNGKVISINKRKINEPNEKLIIAEKDNKIKNMKKK